MTLEQLKTLIAIADQGGILAASEALHKTQPTISMAIKKLEDELDVQLLSREGYRAALTPAGEALCKQARIILNQSQKFRDTALHLSQGNEPEVRIAIEASCPMPLVLEVLARCEKNFPATQFNLMGETLWGALERLELNDADLAVTPWFEENLSLEKCHITTSKLLTVASPEFREMLGEGSLELEALKDRVQVVVRDSSRNPRLGSFGFFPEGRHWHVSDHQTKKEIILAGMGWGRLQMHLIKQELETGQLVPLVINNFASTMVVDICVVRVLDKPVGPVAQALWDGFSQMVKN